MNDNHTPGPWRWEMNKKSKALALCGGGASTFCLTFVEPERWGMNGGTLRIRDTAHDGYNILHKLHERPDWIAPIPGREHHAHWCAGVSHPDMRLIEAAPDLLVALPGLLAAVQRSVCDGSGPAQAEAAKAIRRATLP